jgi:hypothetical protein
LQLLVGALLYLISPRVIFSGESMQSPILRFYLIEHLLVMLMAITLITLGYIRMKRARDMAASRNIFWFYLFSLLLFLSGIPWPFMPYGGEWL